MRWDMLVLNNLIVYYLFTEFQLTLIFMKIFSNLLEASKVTNQCWHHKRGTSCLVTTLVVHVGDWMK